MRPSFDRDTLDLLDRAMEVDVETIRSDGSPRRTTIWLVVDGDTVFARSVRGDGGAWYRAAVERPDHVTLLIRKQAIPVRAVPSPDDDSVGRCSRALASKYAADPATASMLRPAVLRTTVRLEPR